ncbi:hypothetical protein F2Q70_00032094 [Brassica cretica]|uniref:Uncharacterized protein n=1 Tax=Brassica cretica TaxID=69181 RepID=A0A8S9FH50_BRACR|nr:hypothetical protein F2Q70_00032094 [Brassica cretica]
MYPVVNPRMSPGTKTMAAAVQHSTLPSTGSGSYRGALVLGKLDAKRKQETDEKTVKAEEEENQDEIQVVCR